MEHNKIFFISSESNFNNHNFFDGYAFFGKDLVVGNKSFENYYKDNKIFNSYEDGNYILIEKVSSNCYKLTRDYHGYYPIFYYQSADYWCISNSLIYIAENLKNKGIKVTYNEANVELWKSELVLALQLTSHNTFINEIKVLPVNNDIMIQRNEEKFNISLVPRKIDVNLKQDYVSALEDCLKTWRSRYLTILSCKHIALYQDLTGGLDSRCIFSFLANNIKLISNSIKDNRLKINSEINQVKDFEIAERLLYLFNIKINSAIDKTYRKDKISPEESFAVWKYFNVGRYSPIIFPLTEFNPKMIELGGEGGEDNRNFYGKEPDGNFLNFEEYIEKYKRFFSSDQRYTQWIKQVEQSLSLIKDNSKIDNSILHYKEFRSNCHTSKNPKSRFKFGVLGSKYFDRLGELSSKDTIKSGQILYDVIYNNYNKLLYIPFDESYKNMSDENVLKLINVESEDKVEFGTIYSCDQPEASEYLVELPINSELEDTPLKILYKKACDSLEKNKSLVSYYFGQDYIEKLDKKLRNIDPEKSNNNLHTKGSFLHALILLDFISELSLQS